MLAKFAPSNILSNLKENNKNCMVVVGKEPMQISSVKDDINNSCHKDSVDKITVKIENSYDLNDLDHALNSQSLFSSKMLYEIEVSDGLIKKEIKDILVKNIKANAEDYFIFYFKKSFKDYKKQNWFELLKNLSLMIEVDEPNSKQLTQAVEDRIQLHKINLTNDAKKLLINYSLGNLIQADNDIQKIKLIYNKQEVNESLLAAHITNGSRYDGFNFIEHCINGDLKKTNETSNYLEQKGIQPLMINGLFAWFFKAVSQIKLSKNQSINSNIFIKLRIFGNSQNLASKAIRTLSVKQVEACLNKIQEIDQIGKGLKMGDPWLEIKRFSIGIVKMMNKRINLKNG